MFAGGGRDPWSGGDRGKSSSAGVGSGGWGSSSADRGSGAGGSGARWTGGSGGSGGGGGSVAASSTGFLESAANIMMGVNVPGGARETGRYESFKNSLTSGRRY